MGRPRKPEAIIPVPLMEEYRDEWDRFLHGLASGMSVAKAAKFGGMTTTQAYWRRRNDADFEDRWRSCVEDGTDLLEDEAWARATTGKSDYLLLALLKARRPNVYGERVAVDVKHTISWEPLSKDEWVAQYGGGPMIEHRDALQEAEEATQRLQTDKR